MITVMLVLSIAAAQVGDPSSLAGKWIVDLSGEPAKPYTKQMELKLAPDGTVSGSFYDSAILGGRWKTDRGRTCASFRTSDGGGPYQSTVCVRGAEAQGQTWAEHRAFLFNWNASRLTATVR
jgi:hypothetical protein